jgi:hypothetical protein
MLDGLDVKIATELADTAMIRRCRYRHGKTPARQPASLDISHLADEDGINWRHIDQSRPGEPRFPEPSTAAAACSTIRASWDSVHRPAMGTGSVCFWQATRHHASTRSARSALQA